MRNDCLIASRLAKKLFNLWRSLGVRLVAMKIVFLCLCVLSVFMRMSTNESAVHGVRH